MRILFIALMLALPGLSFGQYFEDGSRFVEFVVPAIDKPGKAMKVDAYMRALDGIAVSRMDANTGRYFAIVKDADVYNEDWFRETFLTHGFEIYCFYSGIQGQDKFLDIKRENCEEWQNANNN
jgi:hypothetical protein